MGNPYKEKAGVISKDSCWIYFAGCYMYTADTFIDLLIVIATEWEDDKHLVG